MKVVGSILLVVALWASVFLGITLLVQPWKWLDEEKRLAVVAVGVFLFISFSALWWRVLHMQNRPNAVSVPAFGAFMLVGCGLLIANYGWALHQSTAERSMIIPTVLGVSGLASCIIPMMLEAGKRLRHG